MKNPGDITVPRRTIKKWQKRFRVLADWEITYMEEKAPLYGTNHLANGQITINTKTKKAFIYPCPLEAAYNMDYYVLHELIHVAIRAMGRSVKKEETTVRDLCDLVIDWFDINELPS